MHGELSKSTGTCGATQCETHHGVVAVNLVAAISRQIKAAYIVADPQADQCVVAIRWFASATDADRLTTAAGEVSCELEVVRTCLGVQCNRSAQVREQEHEQREQERGTGVALARASGKIRRVESA